jgi:hypothetical protein
MYSDDVPKCSMLSLSSINYPDYVLEPNEIRSDHLIAPNQALAALTSASLREVLFGSRYGLSPSPTALLPNRSPYDPSK